MDIAAKTDRLERNMETRAPGLEYRIDELTSAIDEAFDATFMLRGRLTGLRIESESVPAPVAVDPLMSGSPAVRAIEEQTRRIKELIGLVHGLYAELEL